MSQVEVDKVIPQSGTTLTIGDSGDTIAIASGATLSGSISGITNLTITGDLTVDTDTLYVDSTNNRVGIGTASPGADLHISSTAPLIRLTDTNDSNVDHLINGSGSALVLSADANNELASSTLRFSVDGSEAMRIDSSGNLLVGTTNSIPGVGNTTLGASLRNNGGGSIAVSRGSDNSGYFNRNTNDGSIISFRKDGTEVGRIGTVGSRLNIGTSNTGLFFNNNQPSIEPADVANSTTRDNAIDLGSSDERFKSLYLSEGIYFQGGSDAVKLDDYEEGTFTPTIEGSSTAGTASYSNQAGKYTKIGNMIAIQIQLSYSGGTGSGTAMYIKGLPFTSNSALIQTLAVAYTNNISMPTNRFVRANIAVNTDFVRLFTDETGGGASNDLAYDGAGDIAVGGIYFV
jgi:hypothetical protein